MSAQRLPMEIILHIIKSVADDSRTIYCPSDPVTKTLLAFTLVCRATHTPAVNHLRRQCMYIEDEERLADCVAYLKATNHLVPEYNPGNIDDAKVVPPGTRLWPITTLYLAPFFCSINSYQQALTHVVELCAMIGSSLARLILDIPFRGFPEFWDREIKGFRYLDACKPTLSSFVEAFTSLTELQDVVWVRDSFFFIFFSTFLTSSLETNPMDEKLYPWNLWPNLQRLALHNVHLDRGFWQSVRKAEYLDTLILVNPHWRDTGCLKAALLQRTPVDPESSEIGTAILESPRPFNIVVAECTHKVVKDNVRRRLRTGARGWPLIDPDNLIKLSLVDFPFRLTGDWADSEDACEYVGDAALRDKIWHWDGEPISGPRRDSTPAP